MVHAILGIRPPAKKEGARRDGQGRMDHLVIMSDFH